MQPRIGDGDRLDINKLALYLFCGGGRRTEEEDLTASMRFPSEVVPSGKRTTISPSAMRLAISLTCMPVLRFCSR